MSLRNGLVGHWTMDNTDTNGGTVYDRSAYSNHATINGGVTSGTQSPLGQGFTFDGTSGSYVPTELFYNTTSLDAVSVSAWYKSSSSSEQIIASSDRNEYWRLGVGSDNEDGVQWTVDSSDMVSSAPVSSLQDGSWHHVVGVFDTSLSPDHKIYIDGELDSEETHFSSGIGSGNTSYTLIGVGSEASSQQGGTAPNNWMEGSLSDVRVYHRGLSPDEVSALYNMRSPRRKSISQWTEGFESETLNKWSVNSASIATDRVFSGSHVAKIDTPLTEYQMRTAPFTNGKEISSVTYWWQETGAGSYGSGIRFRNSNGNFECGVATDNPQWDIDDANGFDQTVESAGYEEWTRFTVEFDWSAGTFGVDLEQPANNTTYTETGRPLKNGVDVQYVEFWDYTSAQWGDGGNILTWIDSVEVEL